MANYLGVGGTDYISYLEADSLTIEQSAGDFAAVASFRLKEVGAANISISARAEVKIKDAAGTLFQGEVMDSDWDLIATRHTGRTMTVRCSDYNRLVEETDIVGGTEYIAYSDAEILDRLFTAYRPDIEATTYVAELTPAMSVSFGNQSLLDAVQQVAEQTGGHWYVDYAKRLHYFSAESSTAAWFLSDYPGGGSAFAYQSVRRKENAKDIVNQVLIVGGDVTSFVENATSVALYGARMAVVTDSQIDTVGSADARGSAVLAKYAYPQVSYDVTTRKTGLRAGMDVRLRVQDWGVDETLTVERLTINWSGQSQVRSYNLELGDGVAQNVSASRSWQAGVNRVERSQRDVTTKVFDLDAPATPTFEAGNLSTGVRTQGDGTQLVWIAMTWGLVSDTDLDHYEAQLSLVSDFSSDVMTRLSAGDGDRKEIWEGLLADTTYYARVRALDWAGNASAWSDTQSITSGTDTIPPAVPTGVTAEAHEGSIHLYWDIGTDADLLGYHGKRAADSGGSPGTYAVTLFDNLQAIYYIDQKVDTGTAYWYKVRSKDRSQNYSAWTEIGTAITPLAFPSAVYTPALLGWSHSLVFSASDNDTVAWTAGTMALSDGTTYNIGAGNTGNMSAVTYVFLDTDVSTAALQHVTSPASAVGANRILVAVAEDNGSASKDATYTVFGGHQETGVFISGNNIAANTITANEIAANTITSTEIQTGSILVGDLGTSATDLMFGASGTASKVAGWMYAGDATKIDGGDIYTNTITVAKFAADATGRMFNTAGTASAVQGWVHPSDTTKIDGGDIFTTTIGISALGATATNRMFTSAATALAVQGWAWPADMTYIDGGNIYTHTINAGSAIVAGTVIGDNIATNAITATKLDVTVGGYNLLADSHFGDDDDADGVPDEWTKGTNITNHTNGLVTGSKIAGASSFAVVVSAGDTSGDYLYISQSVTLANVPLRVGDDFALSGYVKTNALSDLRVRVYVDWLDSGSSVLQTNYAATVTTDQGWTRGTVTNTVPASTVTGRVRCIVELTADDGTGEVWFDAIKLERGDVATAWTTGMIGNVTIDANRVQVQDSDAKVWIGKRGAALGAFGEDGSGNLQVGWYASGSNAGAIIAGAGAVGLDEDGLNLVAADFDPNHVKWRESTLGGTVISYISSQSNLGSTVMEINASGVSGASASAANEIDLSASPNGAYESASVVIVSGTSGAGAYIEIVGDFGVEGNASVDQGTEDGHIMEYLSDDVGHGVTTIAPTNVYGFIQKTEATSGGLMIAGMKDPDGANAGALQLHGYLDENADTTHSGAGRAIVEIWGRETTGTGIATDQVANGNIFAIRTRRASSDVTLWVLDEDGDFYFDGTSGTYDEYDDALMAGDLAHLMAGQYDKLIEHNREAFEVAGVICPQDEHGRFMISQKGVTALTLGALGQLWQQRRDDQARIARLEDELRRIQTAREDGR